MHRQILKGPFLTARPAQALPDPEPVLVESKDSLTVVAMGKNVLQGPLLAEATSQVLNEEFLVHGHGETPQYAAMSKKNVRHDSESDAVEAAKTKAKRTGKVHVITHDHMAKGTRVSHTVHADGRVEKHSEKDRPFYMDPRTKAHRKGQLRK